MNKTALMVIQTRVMCMKEKRMMPTGKMLKFWAGCLIAVVFPLSGNLSAGTDSDSPEPMERKKVTAEMRTPHLKSVRPFRVTGPAWHGYGLYPGVWDYGYFGWPVFGWSYPPYLGEIGRSTVWVAAGSQGYLGGGVSTRQPIEDTPFVYGISISREQGETWLSDLDYRMTTINPWIEWHGEKMSVFAGFSKSSTTFSGGRK